MTTAAVFCAQCGPGYRLGGDGCRHAGASPDPDPRVELIREASALIRARAQAAPGGRWEENVLGSEGYAVMGAELPVAPNRSVTRRQWVARCGMESWELDKGSAEHIASWDPTTALAIAEWLDQVAQDHRPELVDELYIDECGECVEDCNGHARLCCWSCTSTDDEHWTHVFYPCSVMGSAVRIAETYLRKVVDDA